MRSNVVILPILFLIISLNSAIAAQRQMPTLLLTIKNDVANFYSEKRLIRIGFTFGAGALLANSSADERYQNWHQTHLRNRHTDDFAKAAKIFGEGKYLIPLSLAAASTKYIKSSEISTWGSRTARAYLSGAPFMLLAQRLTGASRPGEKSNASHWQPLNDDNGVSGHAFMGAVPFLILAHMNSETPFVKYLFYAASGLTAWSRINDDKHFLSQAALGWYLAWESARNIDDRDDDKRLMFFPMLDNDGYGFSIRWEW